MLSGAWNFREVSGLRTKDGRRVQPGRLFRSSELSRLDDDGQIALTSLGITDVFDLRDLAEVERHGADRLPDGVRVHSMPFNLTSAGFAPHEFAEQIAADPTGYMCSIYSSMPVSAGAQAAVAAIIEILSDRRRPRSSVLVHCAAGKDRTGWVIAVVLSALGVVRDDIYRDYELSNNGIAALANRMSAVYGVPDDKARTHLYGVDVEYLGAACAVAKAEFGSINAYLSACNITDGQVSDMRQRLLTA
ncbi:tyrosine-protein phosphatase [Nocardia sp. NPDC059246]|uniref:tyrosine-protein phosphatase n=1 Tax=unclassified Nocardia TaxID=2637762 RepID=UPI0036BF9EA4